MSSTAARLTFRGRGVFAGSQPFDVLVQLIADIAGEKVHAQHIRERHSQDHDVAKVFDVAS